MRKVEKGNRRAKAKAAEKDMNVAKGKGAKAKWAKEKAKDPKAKASRTRENREGQDDTSTGTSTTNRQPSADAKNDRPTPSQTTLKIPQILPHQTTLLPYGHTPLHAHQRPRSIRFMAPTQRPSSPAAKRTRTPTYTSTVSTTDGTSLTPANNAASCSTTPLIHGLTRKQHPRPIPVPLATYVLNPDAPVDAHAHS